MSKNPFLNALVAITYVVAVAGIMYTEPFKALGIPDSAFILPIIAMLSLLVFSVAFMGFVFFYQPVKFLFEQKHTEAGKLFIQTILWFAVLAAAAGVIIGKLILGASV